MEYKKKLESGVWLTIYEHEDENGKTDSIELAIGSHKDFDDAHCFINKEELFKIIGTLLHIQSKLK